MAEDWISKGGALVVIIAALLVGLSLFQSPDRLSDLFVGRVSGGVDQAFVSRLDSVSKSRSKIKISSGGGEASAGWQAGAIVAQRDLELVIDGACLSACAEFLLPAAKSIEVDSQTLIGLHGNDFIFAALASEFFPSRTFVDPQRIAWLRTQYQRQGLSQDFYKETMARLGIRYVSEAESTPYPQVEIYSVYSMWFPTSEQLRSLWGLEVRGTLCADDRNCWERRLRELGEPNEKFVVGNTAVSILEDGSLTAEPWVPEATEIRIATSGD